MSGIGSMKWPAFVIATLVLHASGTPCVAVQATPSSEDGWRITRTIPFPDQASEMVQAIIEEGGQPDVEASKQVTVPSADAWMAVQAQRDAQLADMSRALAERLGIMVVEGVIAGVTVHYVTPQEIDARHTKRLFIHVHGGAYTFGAGLAGVQEAIHIAHYTKMPVVSIDYRMAPRHPFPAAVDDVWRVYQELIKTHDPQTLALGGTSAGGGLSMASIHRWKQDGLELPGALFAGTPWTDLTKTGDSHFLNEGIDRVLVSYEGILEQAAHIYAAGEDLKNPLISPVYGDMAGFPPTYLLSGTRDLLLSHTVRAHRNLRTAGVVADRNVYEGLSHGGYVLYGSPENRQAYSELGDFLDTHLE